jgi:hypothetical protein
MFEIVVDLRKFISCSLVHVARLKGVAGFEIAEYASAVLTIRVGPELSTTP